MKKVVSFIIFCFVCLMPSNVFALNGSLTVTCNPSTAAAGATVTCSLTASSDEEIYSFEIPFSVTNASVTNYVSSDMIDLADDVSNNRIEQVIKDGHESQTIGNFSIGTFTLKIDDNATGNAVFAFSGAKFIKPNYQTVDIPDTSATIVISGSGGTSTPSGLKSLTATNGVLSPAFTTANTSYGLVLNSDATTFSFGISPATDGATIVINNEDTGASLDALDIPFAPQEGKDSMSIVITVGTGSDAVAYRVLVRKNSSGSTGSGPTLASVVVGSKTVASITDEMNVELQNLSSYQVRATLTDSTNYKFSTSDLPNSCSASGGTLTCSLKDENSLLIKVVSNEAGGASKTYVLTISAAGNTPSGSGSSGGSGNVPTNPQTGNSIFVVAILLVVSLFASLYLYKRNMQNFE